MTTRSDMKPGRAGLGRASRIAGAGLLMVLCCAGPALVAGGALGILGGALGSPWAIGAGGLVIVAALGYALTRRHRTLTRGADCCAPPTTRAAEDTGPR